jgi:hypothetical protein
MRELMDISYEDKLQLEKEQKAHKSNKEKKKQPNKIKSAINDDAIREVGFQNEVQKLHEHQKRNLELKEILRHASETDDVY